MRWLVALLFVGIAQAQVVQHQISDDGYARVPLQFPFPYYGRVFTESYMFSNGVIGFLNPTNHFCCSGYDITQQGHPFSFAIMPLQTDLINYQGRFLTEGTAQYQRYKWENISEFGAPQNLNTFGVEIRPSGYIGMHYEQVNISPWRPVTIGMTGDSSRSEYTLHYHGAGFTSNEPRSYITQTTGDMCLVNPLFSPTCAGYEQAYTAQQCSINPLYRPLCPGYEEAYFTQQCTLNPLYNRNCDGYAAAYATQQATTAPTVTVAAPAVQVSFTGTVAVETPVVSDPVVNTVITTTTRTVTNESQNTQSTSSVTSPVSAQSQAEPKAEKKNETKPVATTKRNETKNEGTSTGGTITQPVYEYKSPIILDLAYQKLVKKPIQDNNKAMYNLLMNSQLKHEEMVNEQYRKRD